MTRSGAEVKRDGVVYLVASGEQGLLKKLVGLAVPRGAKVAASFAAVAGDKRAAGYMQRGLASALPGATRFAVDGEDGAMPPREWRRVVEASDVVFLGGGDPALGARVLRAAGADEALRAARARGVTFLGVSAGSIMLGAFWGEWPEDGDGPGRLVPCAGVVPDLVVDCHSEDTDWDELRLVAEMHAASGQPPARFYGIPSGGALVVDADGSITHHGPAPFVLALAPKAPRGAPSSSSP